VIEYQFEAQGASDASYYYALAPSVGLIYSGGGLGNYAELFGATVGGQTVTAAEDGPLAVGMRAFPNPFAEVLTVSLPAARWRSAEVVDVLGRRVAALDVRRCEAGCMLRWDGADAAPGLYVVRAESAGGAVALPVVLAR